MLQLLSVILCMSPFSLSLFLSPSPSPSLSIPSPFAFLRISFSIRRRPRVFFKMHLTHFVIVRKFEMSLQLSTFTTLWLLTDMCCTCGNPREKRRVEAGVKRHVQVWFLVAQSDGEGRTACCCQVKLDIYVTYTIYINIYIVCTCCLYMVYVSAHVPAQATLNPSHAAQSKANKPKSLIN